MRASRSRSERECALQYAVKSVPFPFARRDEYPIVEVLLDLPQTLSRQDTAQCRSDLLARPRRYPSRPIEPHGPVKGFASIRSGQELLDLPQRLRWEVLPQHGEDFDRLGLVLHRLAGMFRLFHIHNVFA